MGNGPLTMSTRDVVEKCARWQDFSVSVVGTHYILQSLIITIVCDTHRQLNHHRNKK